SYEASGSLPPDLVAHPHFAFGQLYSILIAVVSGIMTSLTDDSQLSPEPCALEVAWQDEKKRRCGGAAILVLKQPPDFDFHKVNTAGEGSTILNRRL
ncbi:MAG: hypothetical protein JO071_12660, partial [Deltaproteobacteria bacterium]|nr:hypothetical protein [Deltaproteobacteria bacterium]